MPSMTKACGEGLFRTSGLREESVAHQAVGTMQQ